MAELVNLLRTKLNLPTPGTPGYIDSLVVYFGHSHGFYIQQDPPLVQIGDEGVYFDYNFTDHILKIVDHHVIVARDPNDLPIYETSCKEFKDSDFTDHLDELFKDTHWMQAEKSVYPYRR